MNAKFSMVEEQVVPHQVPDKLLKLPVTQAMKKKCQGQQEESSCPPYHLSPGQRLLPGFTGFETSRTSCSGHVSHLERNSQPFLQLVLSEKCPMQLDDPRCSVQFEPLLPRQTFCSSTDGEREESVEYFSSYPPVSGQAR